MIPLGPVVARCKVGAARADVWSYLVDPDRRAEWWPELRLEPGVGGAVSERWTETTEDDASVSRDASGEVDVWVEGHAVGFTWRDAGDERSTAVLVTLRSQGPRTGVTVTETGFDALPSASERAAASQEGWRVLLGDLAAAVEASGAGPGADGDAGAAQGGAARVASAAGAGAGIGTGTGTGIGAAEGGGETTFTGELEVVSVEVAEAEVIETEGVDAEFIEVEADATPAGELEAGRDPGPEEASAGAGGEAPEASAAEESETPRAEEAETAATEEPAEVAEPAEAAEEAGTGDPDFDELIRGL